MNNENNKFKNIEKRKDVNPFWGINCLQNNKNKAMQMLLTIIIIM